MSVAQKEWPVRGRILMVRIGKLNRDAGKKNPLSGGVALVTGGSRDFATLEESAQSVAKIGVPVHFQTADVTKSADVTDLVVKTEMKLGQITILVNNAGIGLFGPAHEKTEADWDRVLDTNLKSVFL